jgi:predicted nucleic acid-binding protein
MLAIETNLIVRYLVGDDAGQAARARRLIDNNDVFVCTTVLLETEWVLRSVYGFSPLPSAPKALSNFAGLPRASWKMLPPRRRRWAGCCRAWTLRMAASAQGGRLHQL